MTKTVKKTAEPTDTKDQVVKVAAEQAAAAKVDVCKNCKQRGVGGRYIYDPKTGNRTRVAVPHKAAASDQNGG